MPYVSTKTTGRNVMHVWDRLDPFSRLQLILTHGEAFLQHHLVSPSELRVAQDITESQWEYILEREPQPLFTTLNLKDPYREQTFRGHLKDALHFILQFKVRVS